MFRMMRLSFRELGGTVQRIQKVKKLASSRPPKVILEIIDFVNMGRKKYLGVRKSREFLIVMVPYIFFHLSFDTGVLIL